MRAWVSAKRARSEATRKSQLRASSNPPVTATPFTAPMSGFEVDNTVRRPGDKEPWSFEGPGATSTEGGSLSTPPSCPSSFKSSPAQKAGSAPVRTTASTWSASSMAAIVRRSSWMSWRDRALRAPGRFRVTTATSSATSTRTTSCSDRSTMSAGDDHTRAVSEQSLIGGHSHRGPAHLSPCGLSPQLPYQLAHLGYGLSRDGLSETRQPAAGVDRDSPSHGRVAVAQEALGLAFLAQPDVLVPVELEGGGEVVRLGHAHVLGADARFLVGGGGDGLAEGGSGAAGGDDGGVGGEVGHLDHRLGELRRDGGDSRHRHRCAAAPLPVSRMTTSELHARQHDGGPAVGSGANLEEAKGIGHHGRG